MKSYISIILFIWHVVAVARPSYEQDTAVQLDEVLIQAQSIYNHSSALNVYKITNSEDQAINFSSVKQLLQQQAPVLIQEYGTNSSSISIRGTNADHTSVLWNGIAINSLSLGSADIALLATNNTIDVVTNNFSNNINAGTFGGSIIIEDDFLFNSNSFYLQESLKSFDGYKHQVGWQLKSKQLRWKSHSSYIHSKNNFTYFDEIQNGYRQQTNNSLYQVNTSNSFSVSTNKLSVAWGNWSLMQTQEIPNIIGAIGNSTKLQKDASYKNYIRFNFAIKKFKAAVFSHYIYDYLNYKDAYSATLDSFFVNSTYKTNYWASNFQLKRTIKHLDFNSNIALHYVRAAVSEYTSVKTNLFGNIFSSLEYQNSNFSCMASLRQEFRSGKYILPLFSTTLSYHRKNYIVQLSYADKFHAPDLNDKYWANGGNLNLLPERGFTLELGNQYLISGNKNLTKLKVNTYFTRINNNIIWLPVSSVIWSPQNIQRTQHIGIEATISEQIELKHHQLIIQQLYLYNHSTIVENKTDTYLVGKKLPYQPKHIIKSSIDYVNQYLSIGLNFIYNSKRFSDNENNEIFALQPYYILNATLGYKIPIRQKHLLALNIQLNNLTNQNYQSIRAYAQPLRNILFSITYKINNNEK